MTDWDPQQYHLFGAERRQPFDDLLALVQPVPGGRVIDLGCGTGELTAEAHRTLGAAETVGIDSSPAMLQRACELAAERDGATLRFERGDLAAVEPDGSWDVVVANASLQWVPDHHALLPRLAGALRPGGQLAIQVPANWDHPSHIIAEQVGRSFGVPAPPGSEAVLAAEVYAGLLHDLGCRRPIVRLQVYGHQLGRTADVVEWMRGTLLTHYQQRLPADRFTAFLSRYRDDLLPALGDPSGEQPYFYPFKRILMWGRLDTTASP